MTTEELKPHLSSFTPFVIDGKKTPPPRDMRITAYYDGTIPGVPERFCENMYFQHMGVFKTFMTSWIEHSELLKII